MGKLCVSPVNAVVVGVLASFEGAVASVVGHSVDVWGSAKNGEEKSVSQKWKRVWKLGYCVVEWREVIKRSVLETILVEVSLWKVDGEELELEEDIYPSCMTLYDWMEDWCIMSKAKPAVEAIRIIIITMTVNPSILYWHKKTCPPTELELWERVKITKDSSSE